MTDITKCKGDGCMQRSLCRRYTATVGSMQSWFSETPGRGTVCDHFWPDDADVEDTDLVGMAMADAQRACARVDVPVRVLSVDGEPCVATRDFRPRRRGLHIVDGRVARVERG